MRALGGEQRSMRALGGEQRNMRALGGEQRSMRALGGKQRSMRATRPTVLGIMMAEEWMVEVKTTGPRLADWRSIADMAAERHTERALGMKVKKLENREGQTHLRQHMKVIQRDQRQVRWKTAKKDTAHLKQYWERLRHWSKNRTSAGHSLCRYALTYDLSCNKV